MALKGCDYHTVPLCPHHHSEFHTSGRVGFWSKLGTNAKFRQVMFRLWDQWESKGNTFKEPETKEKKRVRG